jgi:spore maturation protein CgeB
MRIFSAVRHASDPRHYYGGLWSANFYPALRLLGCEVVESRTDLLPASRFMHIGAGFTAGEKECRARLTESIVAELQAAHRERPVDLFLSYFYNAHFDPAGFAEVRRLGIPSVNFYCNSIYQFELVRDVAAAVDFAWHAEKPARDLYVAAGARPLWVQMAADPSVYYPVDGVLRRPVAGFVGQRYADRDRCAAALIRAGVPLDLYGSTWGAPAPAVDKQPESMEPTEAEYLGRPILVPGSRAAYREAVAENWRREGAIRGSLRTWRQIAYRRESRMNLALCARHARGVVPFDKQNASLVRVLAGFEVVLNFSNVWADGRPGSALIPHVRLRDFEAPMCRVCYLTGYTEEITEFYDVGREIDTYRTPEELVDKCRFYLGNAVAAERLRQAGFERARRDHTWVHRFERLFSAIGLRTRSDSVATR